MATHHISPCALLIVFHMHNVYLSRSNQAPPGIGVGIVISGGSVVELAGSGCLDIGIHAQCSTAIRSLGNIVCTDSDKEGFQFGHSGQAQHHDPEGRSTVSLHLEVLDACLRSKKQISGAVDLICEEFSILVGQQGIKYQVGNEHMADCASLQNNPVVACSILSQNKQTFL